MDAWGGRWKNFTVEQMDAQRFNWKDNPQKMWRRLFGHDWSLVWRREVKGYTFVGAQWSSLKAPTSRPTAKVFSSAPALKFRLAVHRALYANP